MVEDGHLIFESRADRNITFRTLGSGFVNVLTSNDPQKMIMLSAGRGRGPGGGGGLASLDDLVNFGPTMDPQTILSLFIHLVKPVKRPPLNSDHILRSAQELLLHGRPLNNDHLPTTATILASQGWSLYTNLTAFFFNLSPGLF